MTPVTKVLAAQVNKKTGNSPTELEVEYTITNGKTLALEVFVAGHEYSKKEARVELLERVGATDTTIAVMYGSTTRVVVDEDFVGDGTRKIVIRATNGDSGQLHMFGRWVGRER